jgi:hypothetical protein
MDCNLLLMPGRECEISHFLPNLEIEVNSTKVMYTIDKHTLIYFSVRQGSDRSSAILRLPGVRNVPGPDESWQPADLL